MIDFDSLQRLDGPTLLRLANSLESGLISPPFTRLSLQGYIGLSDVVPAASFLERLSDSTSSPAQMALVLRAFVAGRPHTVSPSEMINVVVSGPDSARTSRDTGVVMRQLFGQAQERVLAVGFAVHQGRSVFRALADRMDAQQDLQVTLCLDVRRDPTSTSIGNQIMNRFARTFVDQEWPGSRLPGVYFDPRSLASGNRISECLAQQMRRGGWEGSSGDVGQFHRGGSRAEHRIGTLGEGPRSGQTDRGTFPLLDSGRAPREVAFSLAWRGD